MLENKEREMNYIADYRARTDLINKYKNNSLLLYALQLRFNISDIASVASDALTDPSLPLTNVKWSLFLAPFPCIYASSPVFIRVENF